MRQRMKEYPYTCRLESVIYAHGTHFVFPESLLKKIFPIGSGLVLKMMFKAAKEYPGECKQTRIDIDRKVDKTIEDWKRK